MLKVHFLNVGHGDCTIISHPSGRLTVIDINNSQKYDPESMDELKSEAYQQYAQNSGALGSIAADAAIESELRKLTNPIEFLKTHYPNAIPFRFILTHPDLDHMRGLKNLHEEIGFTNFWDTDNRKPRPTFRSEEDRDDWLFYEKLRNKKIDGVGYKQFYRNHSGFALTHNDDGTVGGDSIEILSPTASLVADCNSRNVSNDLSYVLRISYAGKSFLFPGDAESLAWDHMCNYFGPELKSSILKTSHHGRDSGYHLDAIKHIAPDVAIVSVGRKPTTDASNKYNNFAQRVASTRHHGNMTFTVLPDGKMHWTVDRNGDN